MWSLASGTFWSSVPSAISVGTRIRPAQAEGVDERAGLVGQAVDAVRRGQLLGAADSGIVEHHDRLCRARARTSTGSQSSMGSP
jgi:hypothetical protein